MPDLKPRPCPFCGADIKTTGKIMRADGKIVWKHGYVGCAIDGSTIVDVGTWNSCPRNGRRMIMGECFIYRTINTNADLFRAMSDEEQQSFVRGFWEIEDFADWLQQPAKGE